MKLIKLLIFIVFCTISVHAQDFEVSPALINFIADPGESKQVEVNVTNHSDKPTTFIITQGDFAFDEQGRQIVAHKDSIEHSISEWLSSEPNKLDILPNSSGRFVVTLTVPLDATRERWGNIFVETAVEQTAFSADKGLKAGVNLSPRIAIVTTHKFKTREEGLAIIRNLAQVKTASKDSLMEFEAEVINDSQYILSCKVHLVASHIATGKKTQFPPISFNSFPGYKKLIHLKIPEKLPKGRYALAAILDYGSQTHLGGTQIILEIP